jgi:hypothetical protein
MIGQDPTSTGTPRINLVSDPTTNYLSSYLNGISRNNYEGYIDRLGGHNYFETKYPQKLNEFSIINNVFSHNGSPLYRVGHDIHDGVMGNGYYTGHIHPGWHWATDYKTGDLFDIWKPASQQAPPPASICDEEIIKPVRFGAGVHRFFFSLPKNDPGLNQQVPSTKGYMGFAVNVNYEEGFTFVHVPKSKTIYHELTNSNQLDSEIKKIFDEFLVKDPNQQVVLPELINLGWTETMVTGNYLLQFRFRYYDSGGIVHVNYYGIVLSINDPIAIGSIEEHPLRTQSDVHLIIPSTGSTILEQHSVMPSVGWPVPRITTDFSILDEDGEVRPVSQNAIKLCQEGSIGYDNIMYALNDAADLNADLTFVVNTGSGSPREAVGLLEFLKTSGAPLSILELGSEMIGNWNNSTVVWRYDDLGFKPRDQISTEELAQWLRQFAIAIRTSPFGNSIQLALTSTWDVNCRFTNGTDTQEGFKILAEGMQSNGVCMINLVNIHNYPKSEPNNNFSVNKQVWLLGANDLFENKYYDIVSDGLAAGGCNCGLIVTESNTLANDDTQEMNVFMEGMYYAQTFATTANLHGGAFTPFAFCKEIGISGSNGLDPTSPAYNRIGEKRFNLLFYNNNAEVGNTEIYMKPVFMLKKMLAENLGQSIINSNWEVPSPNLVANELTSTLTFEYPKLYVLPTRDNKDIYALIINRDLPDQPDQELEIHLDGQPINGAMIMSLYGRDMSSKRPFKTNGLGLDDDNKNSEQPEFKSASYPLMIKPFSVNIIKIGAPSSTICTQIQAPIPHDQIPLTGYTISWLSLPLVDAYVVRIGTTNNGNEIVETVVHGTTTFLLPTLPPCSDIYVRVLPISHNGNVAVCPAFKLKTVCGGTVPDCTTTNSLDLSTVTWSASASALGYNISIGTQAQGSDLGFADVGNVTQFDIAALSLTFDPCTQIFITISPYNQFGINDNCSSISFITSCCVNCQSVDLTDKGFVTWPNVPGYNIGNSLSVITVAGNTVLTIPSTEVLEFCTTGQMVIQGSGTVILEGTLTSCDNSWLGVVFREGIVNNRVFAGALQAFNPNALVKNAEIGLHFRRATTILLNGTHFLNNRISVRSHPDYYLTNPIDPYSISLPTFGQSYGFTSCTFDIDNSFSIVNPFLAHAQIISHQSAPISFQSCQFLNHQDEPSPVNYGVLTEASEVSIRGNSQFNSLTYGVRTNSNAPSYTNVLNNPNLPPFYPFNSVVPYFSNQLLTVNGATFDHCAVGIHDFTSRNNTYRANTFLFGQMPEAYMNELGSTGTAEFGSQVGIALENNVWGFRCTENKFFGPDEPMNITNNGTLPDVLHTIGTNMAQLGEIRNRVYLNTYAGLEHANISLGVNGSNLDKNTGLLYECNGLERSALHDFWSRPLISPIGNATDPVLRVNHGTVLNLFSFIPPANCFSQQGTGNHFIYHIASSNNLQYYFNPNVAPCQNPDVAKLFNVDEVSIFQSNLCAPLPPGILEPPIQGLEWTVEQTSANRSAYFEAFASRENSQTESEHAFYSKNVQESALIGYQAAILERQPFDSIALWLTRLESYTSAKTLAQMHTDAGDIEAAYSVLEQYEETSSIEIERLKSIWTISQEPESVSKTNALLGIVQSGIDDASVYAKSLLELQGIHFAPMVQLGNSIGARETKITESAIAQISSLKALPNPASNNVQFQITTGLDFTSGSIEIYSSVGHLVQLVVVPKGQKQLSCLTSSLSSGMYLAKFVVDHKILAQTKIHIIH